MENVNWNECILCQKITDESLKEPSKNNNKAEVQNTYENVVDILKQYHHAGAMPDSFHPGVINFVMNSDHPSILHENKAKWHSSCKSKVTISKLQRKRKHQPEEPSKETRSKVAKFEKNTCFIPGCTTKTTENEPLHEVMSKELDARFREYASIMDDKELLVKLAGGTLITLEAKYHSPCAVMYFNRVKAKVRDEQSAFRKMKNYRYSALQDLVNELEESRYDTETNAFLVSDLVERYNKKLANILPETLGEPPKTHTTRLKDDLLTEIPDLQYHKKGKKGYLIFNDKIAGLIHQDFTSNQDENDSKTLRDALRILRQDIFSVENRFNGSLSDKDSQIDSVPPTLLSFICRLMGGAGTEDENKSIPQATCTLTQLVYSNSVKRRRKDSEGNPRQQRCRETPIGIYVGLLLHNATGSESLVDAMFKLGLSISYDRVQEIRKNLGSQICEQFLDSGAVWGYTLPKDTPKAYGFDNANKISSSNTTSGSANFNGTVISVFSFGQSDEPSKIFKVNKGGSNAKLELPKYYTDIEPVKNETPNVPSVAKKDLTGDSSAVHKNSLNAEIKWMDKVQDSVRKNTTVEKLSNLSWAAYFASREEQVKKETVTSQILPVFIEEAATPSMVKHCLTVILKCHEYTNPGEVPWVTADQPLYALLKTIQWRFPETHGEDKLFGVMGALHIEKAAWTCVGQVEDGSGTISLMADADVSTIGVAESCLHCSHISRSRYLNTVGACVHYMLLCDAYQEYKDQLPNGSEPIDMFKWCEEQKSPMFRYHYLLLKLKLLVLQFVRSVRSGDQSLYLTSLTKITYYFFALNHVHYSRWTPVHIRDMLLLPETHPEIHHHFEQGRFTINKTGRRFSNIGLDHGQEQNIKRFKEHGGPLPLTHSPDQLLLYLVAGPEVTNQVAFFQSLMSPVACSTVCHHEQTKAYQNKFIEHTKSLYSKYLEVGNVFTDKSNVLFDLSTDQVKPPTTFDSIMSLESRGKEQYKTFVKDRLVERSVPITEKIPKNKLSRMKEIKKAKSKAQDVKDLKNLAAVLSQLYVVSQVRGADPTEFFSHENVPNPPSISKDGQLYHGTKSDLAEVLGGLSSECLASEQPTSDAVVLDGPAIIHMVAPKNGSTVDEYCKVFAAHVNSYFNDVNRVDVIFDIYLDSSLKEGVRETRGTAPSQIVKGTTKISKWSKFLKNGSNKQRLFEYIAHHLKSQVTPSNTKQLVVTCRDMVITNPISVGLEEILSPCDHEEADTRMILHASNILEDVSSVTLKTVDTDVLVLAVALSNMYPTKKIWVSFGVGDQKKMFSAHEIRIQVGPEKAQALPMFHAFTGCDTVSSFKNVGKKTAWERWASFDDVTDAFLHLTESPDDLNEETEALLERFAILLYDKTSPLTSINLLRKELFNRGRSIEKIPPTSGALVQHNRRTTLQGGHCWGKSTQNKMNLPPATDWGWLDNKQPLWTVDPIASKACKQLTKCGCKAKDGIFKCSGPCGCKRSQQNCTDLCKCKGSCKWWEDNDEESSDDDEDDDGSAEPQAIEHEDLEEYSN